MADVLARLAFDDDLLVLEYSSLPDLLAVGTSQAVHAVLVEDGYRASVVASWRVGSRVKALSFGPANVRRTDEGLHVSVKILAACADRTLRVLTHDSSSPSPPLITPLGPPSRTALTSVSWCSISGSSNLVASSSSSGDVLLWNLAVPEPSATLVCRLDVGVERVLFHKGLSGVVLVYDAKGSVRLVDWTKQGRPTVLFLFEPKAFVGRDEGVGGGMVDWMERDQCVVGTVRGARWAVWDTRSTAGGAPAMTGEAWGESAQGTFFRWCPTDQRLFALASSSPNASAMGGAIRVHRTSFPQSPHIVKLPSETLGHRSRVHGIAWVPVGDPILCVAVGRELVWVHAGGDARA